MALIGTGKVQKVNFGKSGKEVTIRFGINSTVQNVETHAVYLEPRVNLKRSTSLLTGAEKVLTMQR